MKNKILIALIMIVSTIIISIFAFVSFDRKYDEISIDWMSKVSDDVNILDLSIPGTHDSGAQHSIADVAGKCQDLSISSQLEIGVRFLDLRLQLVNDEFRVVHSFVDQDLKFKTVVEDLYSFIKNYNSEFLIISIKEDNSAVNSTIAFDQALIKALKPYEDVFMLNESKLPKTLGEARSKIYILSRFSGDVGIPAYFGWNDDDSFELDDLYIQDNYNISDIEEKKTDILNTIKYANDNPNKLVINFTSCYLDPGFPPTYAGTTALAINPWLKDEISKNNDKLGIMLIDFIDEKLSKAIYMRNIA
jgi:1-phosphatidylinositol phosphodiesterase